MDQKADFRWAEAKVSAFRAELAKVVVGQKELVDGLLTALICSQHLLIEGVPGLAKTLAVKTLAQILDLGFARVQFTPDLLPADLLGTQVFHPQSGTFSFKKGPIFTSVLLADEINRAPAKVQSALLEAMEERQVTQGEESYVLPAPFLVLATQKPLEQEGTYALPEAQLDRFMLKMQVKYPTRDEELEISRRKESKPQTPAKLFDAGDLQRLQDLAGQVHVSPEIHAYIVDLVRATRTPEAFGLKNYLRWGAGPRAVFFLQWAARAQALLQGRDFVVPQDVQTLAPAVLRHRLLVTYEALADGKSADDLIQGFLQGVQAP